MDANPYILEVTKRGCDVLILLATWFVGERVLVFWDKRKKQQEIDLAIGEQMHDVYGNCKEVSKLWRLYLRKEEHSVAPPDGARWALLERACAIESKLEAIIIKLATERQLTDENITQLGLFRKAVQGVRESIAHETEVPANRWGSERVYFNILATQVTSIIDTAAHRKGKHLASVCTAWLPRLREVLELGPARIRKSPEDTLFSIAGFRFDDYKKGLAEFAAKHPEFDLDSSPKDGASVTP